MLQNMTEFYDYFLSVPVSNNVQLLLRSYIRLHIYLVPYFLFSLVKYLKKNLNEYLVFTIYSSAQYTMADIFMFRILLSWGNFNLAP